ncbi:MAG: MBL fold metallo-hydrolase [Xanthomonadales bacterium]|jgi:ribonuclease BN (tRNA processing enzyme)|nr:MBL fold metallo-hydrolase [Xanthomonadales bacterium]
MRGKGPNPKQVSGQEHDGLAGLRFLGVGAAHATDLGASSAVHETGGRPGLLIDCGPGVPGRFHAAYEHAPRAVFITHVHLDHVAGLEQLHTISALDGEQPPIRLYVPVAILANLHARVASLRFPLAEGGGNFWDAFQVIPVTDGFWHGGEWFDVFEVRHHAPGFAWGLRLAGRFVYTGDTRPIPEMLRFQGRSGETLFHDCDWRGNPSHSGWDDLRREYDAGLLDRLVVYHYGSLDAAERLAAAGARVARPGHLYPFLPEHGVMAPPTLRAV